MPHLVALSIVRNEKNRYLKEWLNNVQSYADIHIILDDCSDDGTYEELRFFEAENNESVAIIRPYKESQFVKNESLLRNDLWNYARGYINAFGDPNTWCIVVDADEFYDSSLKERKDELLNLSEKYDVVAFHLCDMWTRQMYRIDGFWSPYFHRMFKYRDLPFSSSLNKGLHHPSIPEYAYTSTKVFNSEILCRHRSYETTDSQIRKYKFYLENSSTDFDKQHAKSILEVEPQLKKVSDDYTESILVASLIRNREWILPYFLKCIENIDYPSEKTHYYFILNNSTDNSFKLLRQFQEKHPRVIIDIHNFSDRDRQDHSWDAELIRNMAEMRNMHLRKAEFLQVDKLVSIDSDILFPPKLVQHLVSSDRDIISPVFWAGWNTSAGKLPQVWQRGGYEFDNNFLQTLLTKRCLLPVGGLGAFTCIDKKVWNAGCNYDRIDNLPNDISGEDRDFCIRAKALGFNLWASTYHDLIHIDNPQMLAKIKK